MVALWFIVQGFELYSCRVFSGPWLILGDFNAAVCSIEKEGGNPIPPSYLDDFVSLIKDLDMTDLGFSGPSFTWSNHRMGEANIREKWDRAIANVEWQDVFPMASISHIATSSSDHVALVLHMTGVADSGPKPFRFHDMWSKDVSCEGVIENCWSHPSLGSPSFILNSKFKLLRTFLWTWNREVFGNNFTHIKESEMKLTSLLSEPVTDVYLLEIKEMINNIMDLYQKEQLY
ncbi:hypothetical protein IFM89_022176 [Coptis chinensis]|uniref:Uncharacterized protein n=1 Tax=Coptis chinensis TaxID=261450 RepID=A0A835IX72_9MAGN|nr:hypothetical protein IFM89_022176 [Coptis chinensis]